MQSASAESSGPGAPVTKDDIAALFRAGLETEAAETGKQLRADGQPSARGQESSVVNLADALAEPETEATPAGETQRKPAIKTVAELLETAGLTAEDFWKLEFRDGKEGVGETHALGRLKDMLTQESDLETRSFKFEENRVRQENELVRARTDLQAIVASLPRDAIKPEILERVRSERARYEQAEAERTLEAIPEWADEARRDQDRAGMAAHLAEYGYGEHHLDAIVDHRMLKYVRDNWDRKVRVDRAMGKLIEKKPSRDAKPSTRGAPQGSKVVVSMPSAAKTREQRVGALAAQFRGITEHGD